MDKKQEPNHNEDAAEFEHHLHLMIPEPDEQTKAELTHLDRTFMGKKIAHRNQKFDDKLAARYLAHYAMTGRKCDSAHYAGVHYVTVLRWLEESEDFGQLQIEAHELWLNRLERGMYRRGVEGVLEPIVAGKDPEIVTYVRKYSDKMLELMARKADPTGYGGKTDAVQVNVNTGVLVVPEAPHTIEGLGFPIEDVES